MPTSIHKMTSPDGTPVYRLWSSVVDSYLTEELSEEELRDQLLFYRLFRVIEDARSSGIEQSLLLASKVEKWQEEMNNEPDEPDSDDEVAMEIQLNNELARTALDAINAKLDSDGEFNLDEDFKAPKGQFRIVHEDMDDTSAGELRIVADFDNLNEAQICIAALREENEKDAFTLNDDKGKIVV